MSSPIITEGSPLSPRCAECDAVLVQDNAAVYHCVCIRYGNRVEAIGWLKEAWPGRRLVGTVSGFGLHDSVKVFFDDEPCNEQVIPDGSLRRLNVLDAIAEKLLASDGMGTCE
jgi:hypothetical protein